MHNTAHIVKLQPRFQKFSKRRNSWMLQFEESKRVISTFLFLACVCVCAWWDKKCKKGTLEELPRVKWHIDAWKWHSGNAATQLNHAARNLGFLVPDP